MAENTTTSNRSATSMKAQAFPSHIERVIVAFQVVAFYAGYVRMVRSPMRQWQTNRTRMVYIADLEPTKNTMNVRRAEAIPKSSPIFLDIAKPTKKQE